MLGIRMDDPKLMMTLFLRNGTLANRFPGRQVTGHLSHRNKESSCSQMPANNAFVVENRDAATPSRDILGILQCRLESSIASP
jgi:hypothetical protein